MKILSVIIPCYNEVNTIEKVIDLVNKVKINKQIILIDDCSTDGSRELIKHKLINKVDVTLFPKYNQGKGACIKEGLKHVKGDAVIIQDADLEYDPSDYIKLVKPIFDGKTNVTYGSRYLGKKKWGGLKLNILGNKFFNWLSNRLNKQHLSDANTCYICFNSKLIDKLDLQENGFAFNPEITAKFARLNENIVDMPISYNPRTIKDGKKIKFIDSFRHIKCMLKYRKEKFPFKNEMLNCGYWLLILAIILLPIILISPSVGMYFDSVFPDYAATQIVNPQKYQVGYTWFVNYPYLVQLYHGSFSMIVSMIEIALFRNTSLVLYRINNGLYLFIILILINVILKQSQVNNKIRKVSIFVFSFTPCLFTLCLTQYYIELPGVIFYLLGTILILKSVRTNEFDLIKLFFGYSLIGFSVYCYFNFAFLSILPIIWFAIKCKRKLKNYLIVCALGLLCGCSLYITSFYNNFNSDALKFIIPLVSSLLIYLTSLFAVKKINSLKTIPIITICLIAIVFISTFFVNKTKILNILKSLNIGGNKITFFEHFKLVGIYFSDAITSNSAQNLFFGNSASTFKHLPLIIFLCFNIGFAVFYLIFGKKRKIVICKKTIYALLLILSFFFLSLFLAQRMQAQHFIPLIFASFIEIVFIVSFLTKNIQYVKKSNNLTRIGCPLLCTLLLSFSILNQYEIINTAQQTGCVEKYTIQINNLCYEANEKRQKGVNEIYVFPEWGFFAPFDYLTNNKISFSTSIDTNSLAMYLENFNNVNVVFWKNSKQKYEGLFDHFLCQHELVEYCNYIGDIQFFKLVGKAS